MNTVVFFIAYFGTLKPEVNYWYLELPDVQNHQDSPVFKQGKLTL